MRALGLFVFPNLSQTPSALPSSAQSPLHRGLYCRMIMDDYGMSCLVLRRMVRLLRRIDPVQVELATRFGRRELIKSLRFSSSCNLGSSKPVNSE
jgi:hypothetical protein